MDNFRKQGIVAGVLFIICTAASITGGALTLPLLDTADSVAQLAAHRERVVTGALIELAWAAAGAGIALALYPVIRRHGEGLALGSVVFRALENAVVVVGTLCLLSLLALSPEAGEAAVLAQVLKGAREWAHQVVGYVFFCLGALMYYIVLCRSRLIPRWLAGWGIGAVLLSLAVTVVGVFQHEVLTGSINTVLNAPLGVQELVLAVFLIVRGFNGSADQARLSAAAETVEQT